MIKKGHLLKTPQGQSLNKQFLKSSNNLATHCDCMISLKAIVQATGEESCSKINTDVTMGEVDVSVPTETQVFDSPEKNFDLNSTLSSLGETPVKLTHLVRLVNEGKFSKNLFQQQQHRKESLRLSMISLFILLKVILPRQINQTFSYSGICGKRLKRNLRIQNLTKNVCKY